MKIVLEFKRLDMAKPITKRPILFVEYTEDGVTGAIVTDFKIYDSSNLGNFYWSYFDFNPEDA